jgi:uncharacterized protein
LCASGGFYSAEDADSIPPEQAGAPDAHKSEGAFYIWSDQEVRALAGGDIDVARRTFGLEEAGNAPHDPHGEFAGRNLLYIAEPVHDVAIRTGRREEEVAAAIARVRAALFAARASRPRPHLDDKILTAWNGLMIAAFARAARVLAGRAAAPSFLAAARRAARFIAGTLWNGERHELLRRYRDGEAAIPGYAEDYAFLVFGLLELFQADGDVEWLDWAVQLQQALDERFWDEEEAGWFSTTGSDPTVLLRLKEDYDGAEPSASAVSVLNLLTLGHLLPSTESHRRAQRTLARLGPRAGGSARAVPMLLCGLSAWHAGFSQIVVFGDPAGAETLAMKQQLASRYLPFAIEIPVSPGPLQDRLAARLDFVRGMSAGGAARVYVCRNFTCDQPVDDPAALGKMLDALRG